ncbi:hypothetical protein QGP82_25525 [Leptothoe sp. LEGE 181152]|nr:hypothetical protein [Leptothoe sp. LEGE 181152]
MVSNESKKISPYELFQEFSALRLESQQLRERLKAIENLETSIGVQLVDLSSCPDSVVKESGVVEIEGQMYFYFLDLEAFLVRDFYAIGHVKQSA